MEHTPTPWKTEKEHHWSFYTGCIEIHGGDRNDIALCYPCEGMVEENASFIIRAVNAYDKDQETINGLVVLLQSVLREYNTQSWSYEILLDIEKALAKAEEK